MKTKFIASVLLVSWVLAGAIVYLHKDRVQLVRLPPASLAGWYKPESDRHVWLHNMFNLRRDMQAVEQYALLEDTENLAEWVERLNEHYLKIRNMVPEWGGRLDLGAINRLQQFQQAGQFSEVRLSLDDLQKSCDSCHDQFRTVTATLYRAPDFNRMRVNETESLPDFMAALNRDVNDIKIAIGAKDQARALSALTSLNKGVEQMSGLCENCHSYISKTYPDTEVEQSLSELHSALLEGSTRQQGEALGKVAVTACAQCHGTHRIAYDTQQLLRESPGIIELFRH